MQPDAASLSLTRSRLVEKGSSGDDRASRLMSARDLPNWPCDSSANRLARVEGQAARRASPWDDEDGAGKNSARLATPVNPTKVTRALPSLARYARHAQTLQPYISQWPEGPFRFPRHS